MGSRCHPLAGDEIGSDAIVEVACTLKQYGWSMKHGKPCQGQRRRKNAITTHAANDANSGGVATIAKMPNKMLNVDLQKDLPELYDSGRWTEAKIPFQGATKCLTVASIYGITGASSDGEKQEADELIINDAVRRAIQCDNSPYLLCGDIKTKIPKTLPPLLPRLIKVSSLMLDMLGPHKRMGTRRAQRKYLTKRSTKTGRALATQAEGHQASMSY